MTDNRHIFHKTRQWRPGSWAELDLRLSDGCSKHREHGEGDHNVVAVKGEGEGGDGEEDEQGLEPGARGGGLPLLQVSLQEPLPLREAPSLL